jgi:hypothetical protein
VVIVKSVVALYRLGCITEIQMVISAQHIALITINKMIVGNRLPMNITKRMESEIVGNSVGTFIVVLETIGGENRWFEVCKHESKVLDVVGNLDGNHAVARVFWVNELGSVKHYMVTFEGRLTLRPLT